VESKAWLENLLGGPISGYCFAGGKFNSRHVAFVVRAGYQYCRSTRLLRERRPVEGPLLHTTMQYHELPSWGYLKHLLRRPALPAWGLFLASLLKLGINPGPHALAGYFMDRAVRDSGCFHLHGHSYELNSPGDWAGLEALFEMAASKASSLRMNNRDAHRILSREARLGAA
jgi:hypothetical protein